MVSMLQNMVFKRGITNGKENQQQGKRGKI